MDIFKVNILGCGSALPTPKHNPSAQVIEVRGRLFLVDCGEGTQLHIRKQGIHINRFEAVFISHCHGDHCLGLIGLISTLCLLDRTKDFHIYGPEELGEMLEKDVAFYCHDLSFEVKYHAVDTTSNKVIFEDDNVSVETIPLEHRVPCCGYLFREKYPTVKEGRKPRSYAYCSDTRYAESIVPVIKGVDLLYHEATYCNDRLEKAEKYYHSTAEQAATIAKMAEVGQLMIGHYSQRYGNENNHLAEAKAVFDNTLLAQEEMIVDVQRKNR